MLVAVKILLFFVVPLSCMKLPLIAIPIKYTLSLETNIDRGTLTYSGKVNIDVEINSSQGQVSIISLNMQGLTITEVDVYNSSSHFVEEDFIPSPPNNEIISIRLNQFISNGPYMIKISFNGKLRDDSLGFFSSSYRNSENEENLIAATNFHTNYARYVFPCFDEPQFLAKFKLDIKHNKNYEAISNAKVESTPTFGVFTTTFFEETDLIPTYAFGFAVLNMKKVEDITGKIPHKIFAEDHISSAETLQQTNTIIEILHDILGNPPVQKLDQILVPNFKNLPYGLNPCGIMLGNQEHLITNRDNIDELMEKTKIIARKYSMQYFGCSFIIEDWKYLWIPKGLEYLFGFLITDTVFRTLEVSEDFILEVMNEAFDMDSRSRNFPMENEVQNAQENFGPWTTLKSASVLRMFQHALSPQVFTNGVKYFINDFRGRKIDSDDFHKSLQKALDENDEALSVKIDSAMKIWERSAGYPVLSVQRLENNSLVLTQKLPEPLSTPFTIPVNFATENWQTFFNTSPDFWMNELSMVMTIGNSWKTWTVNSWIVFNVQRIGFYRVEYDDSLMDLIIQALNENFDQIHVINRAQILNDLLYAVKELSNPVISYLNLFKYLRNETEFLPWLEAQKGFDFYHLMFSVSPMFDDLIVFFRKIVQISYDETRENEKVQNSIKYLACKTGVPQCYSDAQEKLESFQETANKENFYDLCFGLRFNHENVVNQFLDRMKASVEIEQKISILKGLSCSQNPEFMNSLLDYVFDVDNLLKGEEILEVLEFILKENPTYFDTVMGKVMETEDARLDSIANKIIETFSFYVNSPEIAEKFENLRTKYLMSLLQQTINESRSTVAANLKWIEDNLAILQDYLVAELSPLTTTSEPEETTEVPINNQTDTTTPDSGNFTSPPFIAILLLTITNLFIHF